MINNESKQTELKVSIEEIISSSMQRIDRSRKPYGAQGGADLPEYRLVNRTGNSVRRKLSFSFEKVR